MPSLRFHVFSLAALWPHASLPTCCRFCSRISNQWVLRWRGVCRRRRLSYFWSLNEVAEGIVWGGHIFELGIDFFFSVLDLQCFSPSFVVE